MAEGRKHPKGLMVLFFIEMWERYNYYGMRAILVLFMTKAMLYDKVFASNLYGSYTSLVFLTPLIGGYMSDGSLGQQKVIAVGGIVMALGEFVLFFCGLKYHSNPELSSMLFFTGLGLMVAGTGFLSPTILQWSASSIQKEIKGWTQPIPYFTWVSMSGRLLVHWSAVSSWCTR